MDWNTILITLISVLIAPALLTFQKHKYERNISSQISKKDEEINELKDSLETIVLSHQIECEECEGTVAKLVNHSYFPRMRCLLRHVVYDFHLENKGKEHAIRDIMVKKFNVFIEKFREYAVAIDNTDDMTPDEFLSYTMELLNECIESYSTFFLTDTFYSHDEKIVLSRVMDKFNIWHNPRIEQTTNKLNMIAYSNFYPDHKVKGAVTLDMLLGEFVGTITDADNTAHSINGSLTGLVYRGYTI